MGTKYLQNRLNHFKQLNNLIGCPNFSRQESHSRGSDETLSSPRSPEGNKKCYKAVNVINGFTLHPMFFQVCGNSGNQIIVRHYFEAKVAGWLCTAGSTLGFDI